MNKIIAIATNTFREAIRDKVFYSLLVFAILMLCFSMVLGNLTIGQPYKIIKDFGLAAISIFGTLIAIFVGIGSIYKEMEKRTIYGILAKPISRSYFLFGKYIGLSLIITIEVVVMTIGLFLLLVLSYEQAIPWTLLKAIIPIWFELHLILAVALLFSSFSTPFLSGLFTLSIFIIGHLITDLRVLARSSEDIFLQGLSETLYYIFPNLEKMNFTTQVVHDLPIPLSDIMFSILYSTCYTGFLLVVSCIIFSRKDVR